MTFFKNLMCVLISLTGPSNASAAVLFRHKSIPDSMAQIVQLEAGSLLRLKEKHAE
jgi:hypothetical protein